MKLRWVLLISCLGIVLFVGGSLVSAPAGEFASNGPWSRVGTLMSTVGVILSVAAFCYALSVAIRTDRSLKQLEERSELALEAIKQLHEGIRAEAEARRAQHEAMMFHIQHLGEQQQAQHEGMMGQMQAQHEAMMFRIEHLGEQQQAQHEAAMFRIEHLGEQQQAQYERTMEDSRRMHWELDRRFTLSDTIQQLLSRSADLFLYACKKEAQQQGYLNLMLQPERHYQLNQQGLDLLNALSPALPEQIADLSQKDISDADLLFELNLPTLYELMGKVLKAHEALTLDALLGIIVVYRRGGSDLRREA